MKKYTIILALFVGLWAGCTPSPQKYTFSGDTMGTTYRVVLISKEKLNKTALQKTIDETLLKVNKHLSNWDKTSEISSFNALRNSEPFKISPMLKDVMEAANTVHQQSEGYFDVTASPVIDLWGFGPAYGRTEIPSDRDIQSALSKVGQGQKLILEGGALTKRDPQVEVNLSAIAKGFGVDEIARTLRKQGHKHFMVEIGGDLFAQGQNIKGEEWKIGLENPNAIGKVEQVISIQNKAMATSGDYKNFFNEEGQRYSHLINPKTGKPVAHNTTSVSVIAENAMLADAWATALLVMGEEQGMRIAKTHDIAAVFITHQTKDQKPFLQTSYSPAFQNLK